MKVIPRYCFYTVLFFCFIGIVSPIQAQDLIVHPPNWWQGMQNSSLQLLVHGNAIGRSEVSLLDPDNLNVQIVSVEQAESPNYLFINLDLSQLSQAGEVIFQFDFGGRRPSWSYTYEFKGRQQNGIDFVGFDQSDVIYLITPDRFASGDSSNDLIETMAEAKLDRSAEGGRHGGDIQGIIDHLDYLNDLGVTAIWPSPLLINDMEGYSYHGYAITDYYTVDPRFGDLDKYIELADEMRKRGMKLILDGIVNHCGIRHWWMQDKPFSDWVNNPGDYVWTNHRRTTHVDPYASEVDKDRNVSGWFDRSMPDLNQRNPYMATYLIQNSIWWVETLGLGGIRQDTYPYPFPEFLSDWTCAIMNEYPNFNIVGEEWSYNPLIVAQWQAGKEEQLGSCLKTVMDFPGQGNIIEALNDTLGWNLGFHKVYEGLANDFVYANPQDLMVFLDNHDMDRVYTQLDESLDLTKMALTYPATIRGIPQMYYGTEILMSNKGYPGNHGVIRTDFPGGFPGDQVSAKDKIGLSAEQKDMQDFTKNLLNWRKEQITIHHGKLMHFAPMNGVYVYFRYTDTHKIMVVFNKGDEQVNLNLASYKELLNGHRSIRYFDSSDWFIAPSSLNAPPGATIYEFK